MNMAKNRKLKRGSGEVDLDCFLNQPNINMAIPWIYEIANAMSSSRDSATEEDDPRLKNLDGFLNQPNINMTIPWIYQIYKSVKSGGGSSGGSSGGSGENLDESREWVDLTEG